MHKQTLPQAHNFIQQNYTNENNPQGNSMSQMITRSLIDLRIEIVNC